MQNKNPSTSLRTGGIKKGITLIELMVSLGIFCIVIVIVLSVFVDIIRYVRESTQKQSLQDHAQFLFALMSKEIRMAKVNDGSCKAYFSGLTPDSTDVKPGQLYAIASDGKELRFRNYLGECVRYYSEEDALNSSNKRLTAARCSPVATAVDPKGCIDIKTNYVSPSALSIENLNFVITNFNDNTENITEYNPATVSYSFKIRSILWDFDYFNFITARNIDQF